MKLSNTAAKKLIVSAITSSTFIATSSLAGVCYEADSLDLIRNLVGDTPIEFNSSPINEGEHSFTIEWTDTSADTMMVFQIFADQTSTRSAGHALLNNLNEITDALNDTVTVTASSQISAFYLNPSSSTTLTGLTITSPSCDGISPSSSSSSDSSSKSTIHSDITRASRNAVVANTNMIGVGLNRFIFDRKSGKPLSEVISTSSTSTSFVMPNLSFVGGNWLASGYLSSQSVSANGIYRKITTGEFDYQKEEGKGATLSLNGRWTWERANGDDSVLGYFVGLDINRTEVKGSYTGKQNRSALSGGIYTMKDLGDGVYASGYGSVGLARRGVDITDGTTATKGKYNSRDIALGGQVAGSVDKGTFEIRPTLSINYARTIVGNVTLDETASGTTTATSVALGNSSLTEFVASPKFIYSVANQGPLISHATVAPRLLCERTVEGDTKNNGCGAGLELGIKGTSQDGLTDFSASIRRDMVKGVARNGLNLQAEFNF